MTQTSSFDQGHVPPPPAPSRPVSGTVFGILNLVLGTMGLVCSPLSTVGLFLETPDDPVNELMRNSAVLYVWMIAAAVITMVLGAVLIAGGIGLLSDKPYGRKLSIFWVWATIAMVILGLIIMVIWLYIPLMAEMQHMQGQEYAGVVGGMIGGTFGVIWGLAYPVVLLVFMTRENIKAWYAAPDLDDPWAR